MDWRSDAARNAANWTEANREYTDENAETNWALDEISWGVWGVDESELNVLGDVAGLDVVELGCGTAYFSAWLAKLGARPVGVDITPAQLDTARRMQAKTGIEFPLVEADAGRPGCPDASCDLVVSEYGASLWVDPYRWIPEAARLLRPGGRLASCQLAARRPLLRRRGRRRPTTLQRPQFGMHRFEWAGEIGVEFHLPHGEWIAVLRANGFEVERLIEVQAPPDAETHEYYAFVTADWARQWPTEDIWVARKLTTPLILASTSPQRRAILEQLRIPFDVVAPDSRRSTARRRSSARPARRGRSTAVTRPVLGVDTEVLFEGALLGKPRTRRRPKRCSRRSRAGRTTSSPASVCARRVGGAARGVTHVTFRTLTPRDLAHYVAAASGRDAPAGTRSRASAPGLVERVEGDFLNVVGLPGSLLVRLLATRFAGAYGFG